MTTVSTLTPVAPFLTLGLNVTGSGVGAGAGEVSLGADAAGGCGPVPPGAVGVPPHAARVVASKTAPAAKDSLCILLVGINIPMSEVNTVGASPE